MTDQSNQDIRCFHCGLPVPEGLELSVEINHQAQPMCCKGCEAVARAIVAGGMESYYQYRTEKSTTAKELVPDVLRQTEVYDRAEVQRSFVRRSDENIREASLILEGIDCAACVWLNEQHIKGLPGVLEAQVNYSTHRARVVWDERKIKLSDILKAIAEIGYIAHPYDPSQHHQILEKQRKDYLKRLGLAGALGMQVMMFAIAMYNGDWWGMEQKYRTFIEWVSLLLTLPVFLYSGWPFYRAAWRDIKHRRAGMDVPISLGIIIAFSGSLFAMAGAGGHVYFDSVVMFIFFLLTARYLELVARKKASEHTEALIQSQATTAVRELSGNETEIVAAQELEAGDIVQVRPGETIPSDGEVVEGRSSIDESLLSGESRPCLKQAGAKVIGGSINIESPLRIRVTEIGQETVLSTILRLVERAQSEKPAIARLADRVAGRFVAAILLLATVVAIYWYLKDPTQWLAITISVLVVTCPCALSLATPAAITAATGTLIRQGLLCSRGYALETLAKVNHFVFDKTGTLTDGQLEIIQVLQLSDDLDEASCLLQAASLEALSEHPVARAFIKSCKTGLRAVDNLSSTPGSGLAGRINGRQVFLGSMQYIQQETGLEMKDDQSKRLKPGSRVLLSDQNDLLAVFVLQDAIRDQAAPLIDDLRQAGIQSLLFSGDDETAVSLVAEKLGIDDYRSAMLPADKLQQLKELQQQGATVAMLGDGINDAPVLAGADVSIAMGEGARYAAAAADMVLFRQDLNIIFRGVTTARKMMRVIRQNLSWALAYNIIALPLAAAGFIQPWMAALGMSASSLIVVANAMRLTK
ncbi:MAG: heavy metal translocating P-type ATPase [Pseudomonadota bacterium]|nr:heavy metal translocating P-type ATPase [Pseudomonadota bacterium]